MAYDWTTAFRNWTPEQTGSAIDYIKRNYGSEQGKRNLFNSARSLGLNLDQVSGLLEQAGFDVTPQEITQFGDSRGLGVRLNSPTTGLPYNEVADRSAPSGSPFEQAAWYGSRGVALPSNFGAEGVQRSYGGMNAEQRFDKSLALGLQPGTAPLNRFMRQSGMIGPRRHAGLLSAPQPAYGMGQYAPQFDWQQLGGLLGQRAFGG